MPYLFWRVFPLIIKWYDVCVEYRNEFSGINIDLNTNTNLWMRIEILKARDGRKKSM